MSKDTVGKIASSLLSKSTDPVSVVDQINENLTEYDANLFACATSCQKEYGHEFYLVVITKKEPLMQNVIRHYFFGRKTCPTPDYDQTVYKVVGNAINFIWVVPDRDTCHHLKDNALQVASEEKDLLYFVLQFSDGTLFKKAKELNGEMPDSPLLAKE